MPTIRLLFSSTTKINSSAQVGDTVYNVDTTTNSDFTVEQGGITEIGSIVAFGTTTINGVGTVKYIDANIESSTPPPSIGDFILFSKDNKVNSNGLLGYYSLVKFNNDSTGAAELFSVGSEMFESSK